MAEAAKANRATIQIGAMKVDGFMLPDGSYRMSQAGAAAAIEDPPVYALRFLTSRDSKSLLGEAYADYKPERIEIESESSQRGQTRINALPLDVVTGYWLYRSFKGNRKAFTLTWALLTETLERRFDSAFGVQRTETEYNLALADRISRLENDLSKLGEAYAEPDELREENERLKQQIRDMGGEPWQITPKNTNEQ